MDSDEVLEKLEDRLGRVYARQRLGIENDHEAQVFGQGINLFHIEQFAYLVGQMKQKGLLADSLVVWVKELGDSSLHDAVSVRESHRQTRFSK